MEVKTQEEMRDLFAQKWIFTRVFRKDGVYAARRGVVGEIVITEIAGEVETRNVVTEPTQVVIEGPMGEQYIVSEEKFNTRYEVDKELTSEFQYYRAQGWIRGIPYVGKDFKFIASWGEEMICKFGDVLAVPLNGPDDLAIREVYRIEESVFEETYYAI